jgi:hypothetical protein
MLDARMVKILNRQSQDDDIRAGVLGVKGQALLGI